MPADVMTVREFKTISAHWSQKRKWHKGLIKVDNALVRYHNIPKQNIEMRITILKLLYRVCYDYAENKKLFVWQDTRRKRKISATEAVYNQVAVKIKYLQEVLIVEQRLPAMFGVGDKTPMQKAISPKGKWQALIKQVQGLQEYIGKPSEGRQLDEKYWSEAIDPMHTHWKNPQNNKVFQKWVELRHEKKTTTLSFYRWLETLTDEEVHEHAGGTLLHTQYQDEIGREQYRVYCDNGFLRYLKAPDDMALWGTESYKTNFLGKKGGWCIFVMAPNGRLYANSHDCETGWFHAAFLGGKPVKAAGELHAQNGVLYVMTDKSGHYKPQFSNLLDAAQELQNQGVDISKLQLWSRWIDPDTNSILSGMAGMKFNGIWYMAVDAQKMLRTRNLQQSIIFDFGLITSGHALTYTASGESKAIPLTLGSSVLKLKETYQGCSTKNKP